jgi:hypothetical protein
VEGTAGHLEYLVPGVDPYNDSARAYNLVEHMERAERTASDIDGSATRDEADSMTRITNALHIHRVVGHVNQAQRLDHPPGGAADCVRHYEPTIQRGDDATGPERSPVDGGRSLERG